MPTMPQSKANMRLFNGHLKMSQKSLQKVFLIQLNNIFCVKSYLVANLPIMAASASFADLRNAILENADEIKVQLLRMQAIYNTMGETYDERQCIGVRALTVEAFKGINETNMTGMETDLMLLFHMKSLEGINLACYKSLLDIANSLPNDDLSVLLKQNLDMANDSKELYELISKEYIH